MSNIPTLPLSPCLSSPRLRERRPSQLAAEEQTLPEIRQNKAEVSNNLTAPKRVGNRSPFVNREGYDKSEATFLLTILNELSDKLLWGKIHHHLAEL